MSGITVQLDTMPAPVMAAHCRGLFEAIGSFFDDPPLQSNPNIFVTLDVFGLVVQIER